MLALLKFTAALALCALSPSVCLSDENETVIYKSNHVWSTRGDPSIPFEKIQDRLIAVPIPVAKPEITAAIPIPVNKPPFVGTMVNFMQLGESASAPDGYVGFCARNPYECGAAPITRVELDEVKRAELERVNTFVNKLVQGESDRFLYGTEEYWTLPGKAKNYRGDCEDYVLLKRKLLREAGWPAGSLAVTVVESLGEEDWLHAVLTVRTTDGDLLLDNKVPDIRFWHESLYVFKKMQSGESDSGWVMIQDPPAAASALMPIPSHVRF